VERALSGPALPVLYNFIKSKKLGSKHEEIKISPEEIVSLGLSKKDEIAIETLDKFARIYGAEAGNLATRTLAYGGVYLVGSLTDSIKEFLASNKDFFVFFE